jgi:hypothetical protein
LRTKQSTTTVAAFTNNTNGVTGTRKQIMTMGEESKEKVVFVSQMDDPIAGPAGAAAKFLEATVFGCALVDGSLLRTWTDGR